MFDTHSHIQYNKFDDDRVEVLQRAKDSGVKMICVGTDYEMSQKAIYLAEKHEGIWASVGLHPNDNLDEKYDSNVYEELARHPKVVAIGEIGLDYYRTPDEEQQRIQKARFQEQISLAVRLNKPLIIHCREAHTDMIEVIGNWKLEIGNSALRGVIHSFTGTREEAQKYLELGFYIGLNGIITFTDQYNEIVENIPLKRILLETDAPFLTPIPHRGKRNEPSYVKFVAERIAEIKKLSLAEVESVTDMNAKELFNL